MVSNAELTSCAILDLGPVPCRDASPRYVNYVRSVVLCRRTHFRCSCCTGALPVGLWERRAGRPSSLPDASTPVGPELIYRLRTRDSHQSVLVAGSGTNSLQTGCPGVQGSTWRCSTLHRSADPCRRLAWSTNTPFYQCQPPRGTTRQTVNSRQPSLCGCGSTHLEYTAN